MRCKPRLAPGRRDPRVGATHPAA